MELESYSKPERIDNKSVIYWCPAYKMTIGSIRDKARRFLNENLVTQTSTDTFTISPIKDYNTTTYVVDNSICNCQGYHKNNTCSHLLAVEMYKFINKWNNKAT